MALPQGKVVVTKMRRDKSVPARPRDVVTQTEVKSPDFDLTEALGWCMTHGYSVRQWDGGARAWRGEPWVIRTRPQIARRRQQAERQARQQRQAGGSTNVLSLDFAFEG
jgi:hypothetical protein